MNFDEKNFYREFRDFRDRILAKSADLFLEEAKDTVNKFWEKHNDLFTKWFVKKLVMKLLYQLIKRL